MIPAYVICNAFLISSVLRKQVKSVCLYLTNYQTLYQKPLHQAYILNPTLPKASASVSVKLTKPLKSLLVGNQDRTTMSSLISSIQDLISSILGVFRSILATIFSLFENVTALFTNLISSVLDVASGLVGFLLGTFISSPTVSHSLQFQNLSWTIRRKLDDLSGKQA